MKAFPIAHGYRFQYKHISHVGSGRYSLTRPVGEHGRLTNYAKIVLAVDKLGRATKSQIFQYIKANSPLSRNFAHRALDAYGKAKPGYYSSVFTALRVADIIRYDSVNRVWTLGDNYGLWHRDYLNAGK